MKTFSLTCSTTGTLAKPMLVDVTNKRNKTGNEYMTKIGSGYYPVVGGRENTNGISRLSCSQKDCQWKGRMKYNGAFTQSEPCKYMNKRKFKILTYGITKRHTCHPITTDKIEKCNGMIRECREISRLCSEQRAKFDEQCTEARKMLASIRENPEDQINIPILQKKATPSDDQKNQANIENIFLA